MTKQLLQPDGQFFTSAIRYVYLIITGLVLPVVLLFIVQFTGYSEVVEEVTKALIVFFLILNFDTLKERILTGVLFGVLFGVSENIFYLNQIFQVGNFYIFLQRFLWTLPMHVTTVCILVISGSGKKWYILFGLLGALFLHILFNGIVAGM